jgi:hypothetical protein
MATFIHIFAESDRASILRSGIKMNRTRWRQIDGVFLSPVTADHTQTHQWMREVERERNVPKLAARVRLPDETMVWIGRYNDEHLHVTAAEAIGIAREHEDPQGLEVILPRSVRPSELLKVYRPPKVVGWRWYPGAHGKRPCGCPYCQRGEPGARKLRDRYERGES